MKWSATIACLCLVLLVAPASADSIVASASDAGSGKISVSGTVTFDSGSKVSGVTIRVWQEGCLLLSTFTAKVDPMTGAFSAQDTLTYSAGTYSIEADVDITPMGGCPDTYAFKTEVTVQ